MNIQRRSKSNLIFLFFIGVLFCLRCNDSRDISSLLKSSNEDDMVIGSNQIIDGNKQNPAFVPLLINVLKRAKSRGAKCNAILALQLNRKYASKAVPVLISCLKDKEDWVVYNAIDALGVLAYSSKKVVPALLKLNMDNSEIKWHIFRALGSFGPSAGRAVPFLKANVNDDETSYDNREAREALYKITGDKKWMQIFTKTYIPPKLISTIEINKIEVLPKKIEYIYLKQNEDNLLIEVSLNDLNFPDVNSFLLYLKQNIVKIKNKKYIIIASLNISHTADPVIELLIKNKIDVYGKDAMLGGYFKYISIRTDGSDVTSNIPFYPKIKMPDGAIRTERTEPELTPRRSPRPVQKLKSKN